MAPRPRLPALGGIAFVIFLSALGYPNSIHAQDAATGERLFMQRCAGCHPTESGRNGAGPSLAGLMGHALAASKGPAIPQPLGDLTLSGIEAHSTATSRIRAASSSVRLRGLLSETLKTGPI